MPLREFATINVLGHIFRANILPLLQEYFFEDWQRIQWVLNDHRKAVEYRFLNMPATDFSKIFGDGVSVSEQSLRWTINHAAFHSPQAYSGIIE
jgi:5-methylcytosine-specific restriction protein B